MSTTSGPPASGADHDPTKPMLSGTRPGARCETAQTCTGSGSMTCATRSSPSWPRWAWRTTCSNRSAVICRAGCWSTTRTSESTRSARLSTLWMPPDARQRIMAMAMAMGTAQTETEIQTVVEVADDLTSQYVTLLLQGSPPSGKLLIPLNRRDVRVVEGARLESVCRGNSTVGSNPTLSAKLASGGFG